MTRTLNATSSPLSAQLEVGPGPIDPEAVAGLINTALAAHGWAHVGRPLSDAEFVAIGGCLGTIELRTDLLVNSDLARQQRLDLGPDAVGRPVLYEAGGMDFHTDRPTIQVLAWRCVEPDASGGESQWIDVRDLDGTFSAAEIEAMGRIEVGYAINNGSSGMEVRYAPLVERGPAGLLVFYVPWRVKRPLSDAEAELLERFAGYVRAKCAGELKTLRLSRGACLFLDNRRMLHGRASLPPDSRRHLVRLYIRRDERG